MENKIYPSFDRPRYKKELACELEMHRHTMADYCRSLGIVKRSKLTILEQIIIYLDLGRPLPEYIRNNDELMREAKNYLLKAKAAYAGANNVAEI